LNPLADVGRRRQKQKNTRNELDDPELAALAGPQRVRAEQWGVAFPIQAHTRSVSSPNLRKS
jgi:hypothetical protein